MMKRFSVFLFICFFASTIYGQSIGLSGGINRNSFCDFRIQEKYYITDYNPDFGYSIRISISDFKIDQFPLIISLGMDNYKGGFYISNTGFGLGGGLTTKAEVDKYIISLGIYPVNLHVLKNTNISIGGHLGFLLANKTTGYKISWGTGMPMNIVSLDNDSIQINNGFYYGLSGIISYSFKITNNLSIVPQYIIYIGLRDEFKNSLAKTKSLRQNLEIGFVKKINTDSRKLDRQHRQL